MPISPKSVYVYLLLLVLSCGQALQVQGQTSPINGQQNAGNSPAPVQCPADLKLITVPEGFIESTSFNGYIHLNSATSIVMTSIEHINFIRLCAGMTPEFFAQNGLTLNEEKEFTSRENVPGKYYKASFIIDEIPHVRYIVFSGDLNRTLWLNITYPKMFEALISAEVSAIIESIKAPVSDEK
ncbi:MAG: hypothetical protein K9I25_01910 [Crocinitomicaceae bacterium]|jgi:hypothetical protein|nr:hypothetical protein [Crocinitomicaceae bacterium]